MYVCRIHLEISSWGIFEEEYKEFIYISAVLVPRPVSFSPDILSFGKYPF